MRTMETKTYAPFARFPGETVEERLHERDRQISAAERAWIEAGPEAARRAAPALSDEDVAAIGRMMDRIMADVRRRLRRA